MSILSGHGTEDDDNDASDQNDMKSNQKSAKTGDLCIEIKLGKNFEGKTLVESKIRQNYNLNIVALQKRLPYDDYWGYRYENIASCMNGVGPYLKASMFEQSCYRCAERRCM